MEPQERRILIVANYGHFLSHYNMLVFPAIVLPLAARMNLTMAQVLDLSFWQYLLFGITALPWGVAADRWGGRIFLTTMFVGAGISAIGAALVTDHPLGLSLALAGVGLFSGIYHPIGMGLISKGIRDITLAMGYNAVFGGLGLVMAPLATGLFNWLWGPWAAFLAAGSLNLIGICLMVWVPPFETARRGGGGAGAENGRLGAFLILLVAMALGGIAFTGSTVVLTSFLELKSSNVLAFAASLWGAPISSNLFATTVTTFVYLVGACGQYTGGRIGNRMETRTAYLLFHAACLPLAFLIAYANDVPLAAAAAVYFFFLLGTQPTENTLVAQYTPRHMHHSAFGLKFVMTFGIGAVAVKAAGIIEARWSIEAVFIALGLVSVGIVATILVLIWWTNAVRAGVPVATAGRQTSG